MASMEQTGIQRLEFTDADFTFLSSLIHHYAGIRLASAKRELVYSRLSKRLRALGMNNFTDYCNMLRDNGGGELVHFINAITTNVTSFFREDHHFEFLEKTVLPEVVRRKGHDVRPRLRIWSAGCSSGEEPYSIAIVLREQGALINWDALILATDLDTNILDKAQRGIYDLKQLEMMSPKRFKRWFIPVASAQDNLVKVDTELCEHIRFRQLNLLETWPMRGPFDVIFCRNVVIYFDKETQKRLFNRFADMLAPDGYLFIGHSESLFGVSERFRLAGRTIYRKTS